MTTNTLILFLSILAGSMLITLGLSLKESSNMREMDYCWSIGVCIGLSMGLDEKWLAIPIALIAGGYFKERLRIGNKYQLNCGSWGCGALFATFYATSYHQELFRNGMLNTWAVLCLLFIGGHLFWQYTRLHN